MTRTSFNFLAIALTLAHFSCKKDNSEEPVPATNSYVNDWILNNLQNNYLWNDHLPTGVDANQNPDDYFHTLLYEKDRFSVLFENGEELKNLLSGIRKESGIEFTLIKVDDTNVVAIVTYIKPNSPASESILKRGDRITQINHVNITINNYQTLLDQINDSHSVNFNRYNIDTDQFESMGTVSLNTIEYTEDPHLLDTIYMINNQKIGYMVYNQFVPGPTDTSDKYTQEMNDIFGNFKSEGITDLILDLRYNGGGYIRSALDLASFIGSDISTSDIFYEYRFNENIQDYYQKASNADEILKQKFLFESNNIGSQIKGNVYIIVGRGTASASEMVINGLKPYMNVTLIGSTTVGKNVGSTYFSDSENENNHYGMLPIILQIYNSLGQSDYENGFEPDADNKINELVDFMYPMGDTNEILLSKTISLITGQVAARQSSPAVSVDNILGSSNDFKTLGHRMVTN